jgi:hypothetical protein
LSTAQQAVQHCLIVVLSSYFSQQVVQHCFQYLFDSSFARWGHTELLFPWLLRLWLELERLHTQELELELS